MENWKKELDEINKKQFEKGFAKGEERKKAGLPYEEIKASFGASAYRKGFSEGQK